MLINLLFGKGKQFSPSADKEIEEELGIPRRSIYVTGKPLFFPGPRENRENRMNWGKEKNMHTELWENNSR